jgi:hypothetical protein
VRSTEYSLVSIVLPGAPKVVTPATRVRIALSVVVLTIDPYVQPPPSVVMSHHTAKGSRPAAPSGSIS